LSVNRRLKPAYFFDPEDGGDMFLRNVGWHPTDYTVLYPRRWYSSVKFLTSGVAIRLSRQCKYII
jgi:hypothetical protein